MTARMYLTATLKCSDEDNALLTIVSVYFGSRGFGLSGVLGFCSSISVMDRHDSNFEMKTNTRGLNNAGRKCNCGTQSF